MHKVTLIYKIKFFKIFCVFLFKRKFIVQNMGTFKVLDIVQITLI